MGVDMRRVNCIQVCLLLRANAATHKIPIVLLTMRGEASVVKLGLDSGCTEYMLKPVNEEKLIAVFKKYLK